MPGFIDASTKRASHATTRNGTLEVLPHEGDSASGTISAVSGEVVLATAGAAGVAVGITGTWVGTLTFQGSVNGIAWNAIAGANLTSSGYSTSTTANGPWHLPGSVRYVRVTATAWTSGSATVVLAQVGAQLPTPATSLLGSTNQVGIVAAHGVVTASSGGMALTNRLVSSAATTNGTAAKGSAGRLYRIRGYSARASLCFLKLYNKASAPTVGTDTPVITIPIKPTDVFDISYGLTGRYFSTGISYAITGAVADTDTTAIAAGDILGLSIDYV